MYDQILHIFFIIRIFNGCELRIENSVTTVTVQHREVCRVMPNSYPEWRDFQFAPNNHNGFFFLADSKLNTISDHVLAALADDKISDEEFRLILSEVDKYNQMKEEICSRQTQGIGLSETEKNELIRKGREEAIATAHTKLLEDLHQAGKLANQLEYHLLANIITYEKQVFLYDRHIQGAQ